MHGFNIIANRINKRLCCIGMFYEEVNPFEFFTIVGINVESIVLESRIKNYRIIGEKSDNLAHNFNSVNCL